MPTAEPERQLVVFSLHGEHYGLPITSVREIIRYTPPAVTAAASGLVQGMINLRGRVVPIVDLSGRLGRTLEVASRTRILVLDVTGGTLGLIVDTVLGVMLIPVERIEPIPGAVAGDALGDQVAAMDDRLIMLMDPERALAGVFPDPKPARRRAAPRRTPPAKRAPKSAPDDGGT